MPVGLDINPYSIRLTFDEESEYRSEAFYGLQGVVPKWNEPIVWTNPLTTRHTLRDEYISLMDVLWKFSHNQHAQISYRKPGEDDAVKLTAVELLSEATVAHVKNHADDLVIVCVDNLLPEMQQTLLLRELGAKGLPRRELLWRPIALALAHLNSFDSIPYEEDDRIIIVDTDSYIPEQTILTLKEFRGSLVPLREYPTEKREDADLPTSGYTLKNLLCKFIEEELADKSNGTDLLASGAAAQALLMYLDTGEEEDIWVRDGLDHRRILPSERWHEFLRKTKLSGQSFKKLRKQVDQLANEYEASTVLWNGMIARVNADKLAEYTQMPSDSISQGASIYGRKRLAGEPTYLDTIPGLEILSLDKNTGSHKFYTVIPAGEVEGGQKEKIPETLKKFKLEEGTETFTAILRNPTTEALKKLVTQLPPIEYQGENIPLAMNAETQPGQGHAKITIEGVGEHLELFGSQRILELDWESGEDVKMEDIVVYKYNGPEVYPVRGRIGDDEDCQNAARMFGDEELFMNSQVPFRGSQVSYVRVHEPWGYKDPFGNRMHGEPTRAMFGAYLEEDPDIQVIADNVSTQIYATVNNAGLRFKYLNYMFRYAPEEFREELREIYSSNNPHLDWNTVYAVGRTFYEQGDFELFVEFMLRKSEDSGYPNYPDESYTKIYIWSYFRALCFYEDTVGLPTTMATQVLRTLYNYSIERSASGWVTRHFERGRLDRDNLIKYILSAILFSIRFRKKEPAFLQIGSELHGEMVEIVDDLTPRIDYPKTMFETRQPDRLNDYVLRFLNDEQTEQDLGVLKGLVVE